MTPSSARTLILLVAGLFMLAGAPLAHASNVGDIVLGSSGGTIGLAISVVFLLASTLHVADKLAALVARAKSPDTVIVGHPKLTEALDALEHSAMHVLQDMATPELLNTLQDKLKSSSLANVGAWLAVTYGPKLLKDVEEQGTSLLGTELKLIFGGDKAVTEAAVLRLGMAASQISAANKQIVRLPSGALLVKPDADPGWHP